MSQEPIESHPGSSRAPVALDALAYGINSLDAILVLYLGDAHLHAAWVRPESGLHASQLSPALRDAYHACQLLARRVMPQSQSGSGSPDRLRENTSPLLTLELPVKPWSPPEPALAGARARPSADAVPPMPACRTAILRRVRSHVIACLFDPAMPLGMARVIALRLTARIEPELPREIDRLDDAPALALAIPFDMGRGEHRAPEEGARSRALLSATAERSSVAPRLSRAARPEEHAEREPSTLPFGESRPHRVFSPEPRATASEIDRIRKLLAYFDVHAPEPHVARQRLALRAGLTLSALEDPRVLGPEAIVLIETAVEEILGMDSVELRGAV